MDEFTKKFYEHLVITIDSFNDGLRELLYEYDNGKKIIEEVANSIDNEKNEITFEEIRTLLADKARKGKSENVKELLKIFNADKLSDIETYKYKELYEMAEQL